MLKILLFPVESIAGIRLKNDMLEFFEDKDVDFEVVDAAAILTTTQEYNENSEIKAHPRYIAALMFMSACLEYDWIIVDLTRETGFQNNYDIIGELPKHLATVSVVSRNYLPLNMYDLDQEGYPDYLQNKMANFEIMNYVKKRFEQESLDQTKKFDSLSLQDLNENSYLYFQLLEEQRKIFDQKNKQRNGIFISFRTKYESRDISKEISTSYQKTVSELKASLDSGNNHDIYDENGNLIQTDSLKCNYIQEGDLIYAKELLSPFRSWQVLAYIDNYYINACSEFWIYATADYWNSWWTRGELIAFYYLFFTAIEEKKEWNKIIRIYNPVENQIIKTFSTPDELKQLFDERLSIDLIKKYSRIYANCNINTMGPESVKTIQQIKNNPTMVNDLVAGLKTWSADSLETMRESFQLLKEMSPEELDDLENSDDPTAANMLPFAKMIFGWSDDQLEQYLANYNEMANNIQKYLAVKPQATDEEIYSQVAKFQMGNMGSALEKATGMSIETVVSNGLKKDFTNDDVFSEGFFNDSICILSAENNDKGKKEEKAFTIPRIDDKTLSSFFKLPETPNIKEKEPYMIKIEKSLSDLKNTKESEFCLNGEIYQRKNSRFVYLPKRFGTLIDWSENHDCLEEIPVFVTKN